VHIRKDLVRLFQGQIGRLTVLSAIDAPYFDNGDLVFRFDRLFVHLVREKSLIDAQVSLSAKFANYFELVDLRAALEPATDHERQGWGLDEAIGWLINHYDAVFALIDSQPGRDRLASIADAREQAMAEWIENMRAPEDRALGPLPKSPRQSPIEVSRAYATYVKPSRTPRFVLVAALAALLAFLCVIGWRYLENGRI
jgi:hypothetical protein